MEGREHSSRRNGIIADGSRVPTHWTELEYSGLGGFRRSTADVAVGCSIRGYHYPVVDRATKCRLGCAGCSSNNLADDVWTWTPA